MSERVIWRCASCKARIDPNGDSKYCDDVCEEMDRLMTEPELNAPSSPKE